MIRTAVDRSRPTRTSMVVSTGVHALLLLLLMFAMRPGGPLPELAEELTKISYIEASHTENVAEKVMQKTLAKRTPLPADAGRGISTRSAVKPKNSKPAPAEPKVADAIAPVPSPQRKPEQLAAASRLQSRSQDLAQIDVPTQTARSERSLADAGGSPELQSRAPRAEFEGASATLSSKRSALDLAGGDIDPSAPGTRGLNPGLADASGKSLGGGALSSKPGKTYAAPGAGLDTSRRGRGGGVADIAGAGDIAPPSGGGGSDDGGGRRTILDYGSGGGGLRSRGGGAGGIAPATDRSPVSPSRGSDKAQDRIAEAGPTDLSANGMDMSISGQISGRKILKMQSPDYSAKAKRNGWEGVVAVHFTVLPDGRVKDNLYFEQTSAHRDLNRAAMSAIQKFLFAPLPSGDPQVEQWGVITFVFRLK